MKVKVLFTVEQARKAQRGKQRYSFYPFLNLGGRWGWTVNSMPWPLYPLAILQQTGWAPGPVWTGAENLASSGIRSPNRPARIVIAIPTELCRPMFVCLITIPIILSERRPERHKQLFFVRETQCFLWGMNWILKYACLEELSNGEMFIRPSNTPCFVLLRIHKML